MRKFLLFPAFAALYVLGCSGDSSMPCGSCGDDSKCGNEWYNSFKQFCYVCLVYDKCDGMTFAADKQGCCGSMIYNLSSSFCSCDVAYSYACFSKVYDKCGGREYNLSTQFCSDNSVYDKCDGNTYNPPNQRCKNNVVESKCGTGSDYYNSSTQFCTDNKVYNRCDGQSYIPISQRCGIGNVIETKCGSDWYNPATHYCKNGTALTQYGSLEYAGQTYRTVVIGTQTWMAQNLNYNASNSRCYGDNTGRDSLGNCAKYGRLYDWATAMGISSDYNNSPYNPSSGTKYRGVCPNGWHIPNNDEWTTLTGFVGDSAGTKLKATSGWSSGNGTDEFGFSTLPGGGGFSGGTFGDVDYGLWWSTMEYNASNAYFWRMGYGNTDVYSYNFAKPSLFSVRCVKD